MFGNGDGGGGPLPKMLENVKKYNLSPICLYLVAIPNVLFIQLRRIKATTNTHRELPSISMGHSADEFFVALDQDTEQGKTLPNWWVNCVLSIYDVI